MIVMVLCFMLGSTCADRQLQQGQNPGTNAKAVNSKSAMASGKPKLMQADFSTCGGAQQIGTSESNLCW